jgi:hypothetical protein
VGKYNPKCREKQQSYHAIYSGKERITVVLFEEFCAEQGIIDRHPEDLTPNRSRFVKKAIEVMMDKYKPEFITYLKNKKTQKMITNPPEGTPNVGTTPITPGST